MSRTELPEVLGSKEEFIKSMSTMYETFYESQATKTTTIGRCVEKEEKEKKEERQKKRRRKKDSD